MIYFFLKEKVSKKNFRSASFCLRHTPLSDGHEREVVL